jgi:hypothetical protein
MVHVHRRHGARRAARIGLVRADRPGVAEFVERVDRVADVCEGVQVEVGVESAGHYHRPVTASSVLPSSWTVIELNPAHVTEQRRVLGKRGIKTDQVDLAARFDLLVVGRGLVLAPRSEALLQLQAWAAMRHRRIGTQPSGAPHPPAASFSADPCTPADRTPHPMRVRHGEPTHATPTTPATATTSARATRAPRRFGGLRWCAVDARLSTSTRQVAGSSPAGGTLPLFSVRLDRGWYARPLWRSRSRPADSAVPGVHAARSAGSSARRC